jgi:hypothetical protein
LSVQTPGQNETGWPKLSRKISKMSDPGTCLKCYRCCICCIQLTSARPDEWLNSTNSYCRYAASARPCCCCCCCCFAAAGTLLHLYNSPPLRHMWCPANVALSSTRATRRHHKAPHQSWPAVAASYSLDNMAAQHVAGAPSMQQQHCRFLSRWHL